MNTQIHTPLQPPDQNGCFFTEMLLNVHPLYFHLDGTAPANDSSSKRLQAITDSDVDVDVPVGLS